MGWAGSRGGEEEGVGGMLDVRIEGEEIKDGEREEIKETSEDVKKKIKRRKERDRRMKREIKRK